MEELTQDKWAHLMPSEQKALAARIARSLPDGFAFRRIVTHSYCGQHNAVAEFAYGDAAFVLIPGGEVSIGYDAARDWQPTPEEAEDWQQTAAAYEFTWSVQEQIARATRRPKMAFVPSFLMETTAVEAGWKPLAVQEEVQRIVREEFGTSRRARRIEVVREGGSVRVTRDANGVITAERSWLVTQGEIAAQLAQNGFRLPTSDEWEYACGAGAAALFRWGDHAPCDRYPTDISPKKAAWRREWASSGGALKPPPEGFAPDWSLHTCANAFGIYIAHNPYHYELVAEPGITRGGDGGGTICGGAGFLMGWLTLATAYYEAEVCERDPAQPIDIGYTYAGVSCPFKSIARLQLWIDQAKNVSDNAADSVV